MRTYHIWVKSKTTDEVKCKVVKRNNFTKSVEEAYMLVASLKEKTGIEWDIVSLNDISFSHNPKVPMV